MQLLRRDFEVLSNKPSRDPVRLCKTIMSEAKNTRLRKLAVVGNRGKSEENP
jgi:hypothetical protein